MKAERLPNGDVKLFGSVWFDVFPEGDRARWIAFYEGMFASSGYDGYRETAENLKALGPLA